MLLTPSISPKPPLDSSLDQQQLYALGLDHIRRLSRQLWTDHNVHDPGITTLELLCYTLTDLSYRAQFSVEDLLATPDKNAENMAAQFFTARQILPNEPLTTRDYRKLLIDLPDVKNAWVHTAAKRFYADTIKGELLLADPHLPGTHPIDIKGLYEVSLEYSDKITTAAQRKDIRTKALKLLNAHRNLCEDFVSILDVAPQPYTLCAELELETDASQVEVAAQIRFQVERYLAPPVHAYSLTTMLARQHADGSPYTVAEIFEGPALKHGFIDDADLDASELRTEIRLSDIISIIMDIPGVRAVRDIIVNQLVKDKVSGDLVAIEPDDKWRLAVPSGMQPMLSNDHGRMVFYKRNVPVPAQAALVNARIAELEEAERLNLETVQEEDLPIPLGRAREVDAYHSFQLHFPVLYGLSQQGLNSSDPQRQAQALQLKGYLLFFDQLMANYLAQLANLRHLYSRNFATDYLADATTARTYFAQVVDSFPDYAKIYGAGIDDNKLGELLEDNTLALQRRNHILDQLLARYGEEFHHYSNVVSSVFGASPASTAVTKCNFLANTPRIGAERGLAYNYSLTETEALWNSFNVSGLERRIARLLGISNFSRRNLATVSYVTYTEIDKTPGDEFRFRVKHPVSGKIVLSSSTNYATPEAAQAEMQLAIGRAQVPEGYERKLTVDGKHYFNIINEVGEVIARRIEYFATSDAMEAAITALVDYLREYYSGEGMYVIENLLLMPQEKDDPFMPICVDPNCEDCADDDPYSYRLHFVLPAYAGRFQNMDFRRFVEETIRQETPAHILPKVCWVNSDDMAMLEAAYRDWIPLKAGVTPSNRKDKLDKLIYALFHIKSIYPTRLLFDCSCDEEKPPFILGRTSLGSMGGQDVKS
ncbi:MAG TPA: hypothetical protein VL381_02330 [Rhodocyclaceae bacterium]|nr:hypothetical protein [Rhodocyclaceae bacterium]